MEDENQQPLISRRDFFKYSLLGISTLAFQGSSAKWLAASGKFKIPADIEKWKWKTKARHCSPLGNSIQCELCPNLCRIRNGQQGICQVKVNFNNTLYSVGYGNPCAVHVDPIEKKPFFHFLPSGNAFSVAVAGCSLSCLNCQNWSISQASPFDTENTDLMPAEVVKKAKNAGCSAIAYTYSEPIVFYEYAFDTAKLARAAGIKNIFKTSGYINEKPLLELIPWMDAANVDLKSFRNETYRKLNAGSLAPVLNTLKTLKNNQVWVEITNLVIPQWTDDAVMIREMCRWLAENGFKDTPLHFSRFTPMYQLNGLPPTSPESLLNAAKIAAEEGLQFIYIGNYPSLGYEKTNCPGCGKTLIERKGFSVKSNFIKQGKCSFCNRNIPGVW